MKRPIFEVIKFGGYPWFFLLAIGGDTVSTLRAAQRFNVKGHRCSVQCLPDDDAVNGAERGRERTPLDLHTHDRGQVTFLKCSSVVLSLRDTSLTADSIGTIAHECLHVVARHAAVAGLQFEYDTSEEAWCYALGDIVSQVVHVVGQYTRDGRKIKRRKRDAR